MKKPQITLEDKKKQITAALIKRLGLDKRAIIEEAIKANAAVLINDNAAKVIEADVKRRIKEPSTVKDTNTIGPTVNKKLESLQKKLNMYNMEKPKGNDRPVAGDTLYSLIYERYIMDAINEFTSVDAQQDFDKNKDDQAKIDTKIASAKKADKTLYDPSALSRQAKNGLSTKNFAPAQALTKNGTPTMNSSGKSKVEANTKNEPAQNSKELTKSVTATPISKAKTAKKDAVKDTKHVAQNKKTPTITKSNSTINKKTIVRNDTKETEAKDDDVQQILAPTVQPKKYMIKLERFYTELITEIHEENDRDANED